MFSPPSEISVATEGNSLCLVAQKVILAIGEGIERWEQYWYQELTVGASAPLCIISKASVSHSNKHTITIISALQISLQHTFSRSPPHSHLLISFPHLSPFSTDILELPWVRKERMCPMLFLGSSRAEALAPWEGSDTKSQAVTNFNGDPTFIDIQQDTRESVWPTFRLTYEYKRSRTP